jgi:hypothetical protein
MHIDSILLDVGKPCIFQDLACAYDIGNVPAMQLEERKHILVR